MIVQRELSEDNENQSEKVGDFMPMIEPEIIDQARKIDLLTYLQNCEPHELIKISPNNYTTRTHDSLKISNGKWMWWSRHIGGYNALDYLVKVKEYTFVEAIETLMGKAAVNPTMTISKPKVDVPKVLLLPGKSNTTDKITEYLLSRGIDATIIEYCISHDLIFESLPYHNIVFVGYDSVRKPRYAAYRATNSSRLMGDCSGSDKHFSFRIVNSDSAEVHLFEGAVDLLSYATLTKLSGKDWRKDNLVSLAGVYMPKENIEDSKMPVALQNYLDGNKNVCRIYLHFDTDRVGRKATQALKIILPTKYEVIDSPPPYGKDYNDFLRYRLVNKHNIYCERKDEYERKR